MPSKSHPHSSTGVSTSLWTRMEGARLGQETEHPFLFFLIYFLKILFIYLFLERGEGKERNINVWLPLTHPLLGTWPATQARALTGNRTGDPLVCRSALNPLSHTSQSPSILDIILGTNCHSKYAEPPDRGVPRGEREYLVSVDKHQVAFVQLDSLSHREEL